jgi:hypothetical protein
VPLGQFRREGNRAPRFVDRTAVKGLELARVGMFGGDSREDSREPRMGQREIGVGGDRQLEIGARFAVAFFILGEVEQRPPAQIGLVGADIARSARSGRVRRHLDRQSVRDGSGNLGFEGKDVVKPPVDPLRPFGKAGASVGEVGGDPNYLSGALDRAFEQVRHVELSSDGSGVRGHIRRRLRRRCRQDHQPGVARQRRANLLGQSVGQIGLGGIAAEVLEGQDGDALGVGSLRTEKAGLPRDQRSASRESHRGGRAADDELPARYGRSCGRRLRDPIISHRGGNGPPDGIELRGVGAAVPARNVDHLDLAEPERRQGSIDRQRNQPVAIAALRRFVLNPVGFDGLSRPQDNDHVGGLERLVDRACIARAALDQRVPPNDIAASLQRGRKALRSRLVAMRVAQKQGRLTGLAQHDWPPPRLRSSAYRLTPRQGIAGR